MKTPKEQAKDILRALWVKWLDRVGNWHYTSDETSAAYHDYKIVKDALMQVGLIDQVDLSSIEVQ